MATNSFFPTSNLNNSWGDPTYAYTDDTNYASYTVATSGSVSGEWSGYDFSEIPTGSTINDVYMRAVAYRGTNKTGLNLDCSMWDGSTQIGSTANSGELVYATPTDESPLDQGTHPTLAQLNSANFKCRVVANNTNSKYTLVANLDFIAVYVDWTPPSGSTKTVTNAGTHAAVVDADHSATLPQRIKTVANAGTHSVCVQHEAVGRSQPVRGVPALSAAVVVAETAQPTRIRCYHIARNLDLNPRFIGTGGDPDNWQWGGTYQGTPVQSLIDNGDGTYGWRVQYTGVAGDDGSKWLQLVDQGLYLVNGSVKEGDSAAFAVTISGSKSGIDIGLGLIILNSGGSQVNNSTTWGVPLTETPTRHMVFVSRAGSGAYRLSVTLSFVNIIEGDTIDIEVEYPRVDLWTSAYDYFDGADSGYFWSGTADASFSVQDARIAAVVAAEVDQTKVLRVRRYNSLVNLIDNPGFVLDSNSDGIPDGWTLYTYNLNGTPVFTREALGDGRYRCHFQYSAVSGDADAAFYLTSGYTGLGSVEAGDALAFQAELTMGGSNSGVYPGLNVSIRNASYTTLASFFTLSSSNGVVRNNLAAPAGASVLELRLYAWDIDFANGDVADFYWQEPSAVRNGELLDYFDGESSGCYWAGTQYLSDSVKTPPKVGVVALAAGGGKIRTVTNAGTHSAVVEHGAWGGEIERATVSVSAVVDADTAQPLRIRRSGTQTVSAVTDVDSTAAVTRTRRGITTAQSVVVAHEAAGSKVSGETKYGEANVSLCVDADTAHTRVRIVSLPEISGVVDIDATGRRIRSSATQTVAACVDADTVARRIRPAAAVTVSAAVDADAGTPQRTRRGVTTTQSAVVEHSAAGTLLGTKSAGTQTVASVVDADAAQPGRIRKAGTLTASAPVDADTGQPGRVRRGLVSAQSLVVAQGATSGNRIRRATVAAQSAVVAQLGVQAARVRKGIAAAISAVVEQGAAAGRRLRSSGSVPVISAVVEHGAIGGEVGRATASASVVVDADTAQPRRTRIVSGITLTACVDADATSSRIKRGSATTISLVADADTGGRRIRLGQVSAISLVVDADATARRLRGAGTVSRSLVVDADATSLRTRRGISVAQSAVVSHTASGGKLGTKFGAANVSLCVASGSTTASRSRGAGTATVSAVCVLTPTQPIRQRRGLPALQSAVVNATGSRSRTRGGIPALSSAVVTATGAGNTTAQTLPGYGLAAAVVSSTAGGRRLRTARAFSRAVVGMHARIAVFPRGYERDFPPLWIYKFKPTARRK